MPQYYKRKHKNKYNRRVVCQLSLKGELIKEWDTVGQACGELGLDKSALLRCCKGKQQKAYWYMWKFKDDLEKEKLAEQKKSEKEKKAESKKLEKEKVTIENK